MLTDFDRFPFEFGGKVRDVYRKGTGPGILLIHEIPGITPEVIRLANILVDEGFTVFLPVLFGVPGKAYTSFYGIREIIHVCISREFYCFSKHKSSPVTNWLRSLSKFIHEQCSGKGVGALGMCFSGGFVLSLILDDFVLAPVMSQPSLPFPISRKHREALGISAADLLLIKRRIKNGLTIQGLRFTCDKISPPERFNTLRQEFGYPGFDGLEIDSSGTTESDFFIPRNAHSVLTTNLVLQDGHPTKDAIDRVLLFFKEKL